MTADLRAELEAHRLAIRLGDDVEALAAGDRMCAALEAVVGVLDAETTAAVEKITTGYREGFFDGVERAETIALRAITAALTEMKEPSDG